MAEFRFDCPRLGASQPTFYRRKKPFAGIEVTKIRHLKRRGHAYPILSQPGRSAEAPTANNDGAGRLAPRRKSATSRRFERRIVEPAPGGADPPLRLPLAEWLKDFLQPQRVMNGPFAS